MELASATLTELAMAIVAGVVVLAVALILWRILKKAIGGCISMGLGCLVLLVGLAAIALFLLSRYGIASCDDLLRILGP